jgi:ribosomal protein S1
MNRPNDDQLSREIEAALEGVNLQDLDQPRASGGKGGKGSERDLMRGTIVGISGNDVFVELGPRMQGVAALSEFSEAPKVGETYEFKLNGREDDLWKLVRKKAPLVTEGGDIEVGACVKARVTGQNAGGLELMIGSVRAFMPASQVGMKQGETLAAFLTQNLTCEVMEVDKTRKRVLVSRRVILDRERDAQRKESVGRLSTGMRVSGKVVRVEPFGAFVDLGGGLEGMVHVSNISRKRTENATQAVAIGDSVEAEILEIKENGKRIALSMKALEPDPWQGVGSRYSLDMVIRAKITRLSEFGAFVELEPGVEGLLHLSQMGKERVRRAQDLFKVGDEVDVRISQIDAGKQRISLSRLDSRGALLGSEESVDAKEIDNALQQAAPRQLGTNLGALFQKLNKP